MKGKKISVYLPSKIKKIVHIEAIRKDTTMGSILSEAVMNHIKRTKKMDMEEKKMERKMAEYEALQREADEIEQLLEEILQERKEGNQQSRFKNTDKEEARIKCEK
jgi:peroxiredoxin family protein